MIPKINIPLWGDLTYNSLVFWHNSLLYKSPTGKLVEILAGVHRPVHLLQEARCLLLTALGVTNLASCVPQWTVIQADTPISPQSFIIAVNLSCETLNILYSPD